MHLCYVSLPVCVWFCILMIFMSKTQHSWSRGLLFSPRISRLIKEVDENNDDEIELSEFLCLLGHVRRLMLLGEQGMTYHPRVSRKSFYASCHTIFVYIYILYIVYICEVLGAHIFRSTLANHLRTQSAVAQLFWEQVWSDIVSVPERRGMANVTGIPLYISKGL